MWERSLIITEKKEFWGACDVMFFDLSVSYIIMFSLQKIYELNTCWYFL